MSTSCTGVVLSAYQAVVKQLSELRPTIDRLDKDIFPDNGPTPKSIIEISGYSNSGKSLMLSEIMTRCLPPTYYGGRYCDIVFIDMDHKFSPTQFVNNIKRIIKQSGEHSTVEEINTAAEDCLDSMQILNCYSSEEFLLAIDSLEEILRSNQNIALIAIDNIEAFYWEDAYKNPIRKSTHYSRNLKRLTDLADEHNVACVYTVDSNYLESKRNLLTNIKSVMPTHKFQLQMLTDGRAYLKLFGHGSKQISFDDNGLNFSSKWICFQ